MKYLYIVELSLDYKCKVFGHNHGDLCDGLKKHLIFLRKNYFDEKYVYETNHQPNYFQALNQIIKRLENTSQYEECSKCVELINKI